MITGELKNKIDGLWDTFTAGGLKNPLEVIEQMPYELAIAIAATVIIAAILAVIIIIVKSNKKSPTQRTPRTYKPWIFETPERRAGRRGEMIATDIIKGVLRDGDYLLTNVSISYDGRPAELDNVVVNKYGVFIIEVKNYKGRLCGEEDVACTTHENHQLSAGEPHRCRTQDHSAIHSVDCDLEKHPKNRTISI